jgi:predicted nucleic-acid-binding protein
MAENGGSLDANVLLRLLVRDVPQQTAAASNLLKRSRRFHVADIAVIETVFALERYYEVPRPEIAEIVRSLISHPQLNINADLFEGAMELYPHFPKLSCEDCCLAVYANLNNALPLWTFDSKLSKQSGGLARMVPG